MAGQHGPLKVDRTQKTLKERALATLREAIIDFHFEPGERLVERKLCEQLGVSRTVVREVLRHLESEGLVQSTPHQGPAVATIDEDQALQIYELRAQLEAIGARACAERASDKDLERLAKKLKSLEVAFGKSDGRAIQNATTAFYEAMFEVGGKSIAWSILQSLNARVTSLRRMTITSKGRAEASLNEMKAIMSALSARDPDRAERACREHVRNAAAVAAAIFEAGR